MGRRDDDASMLNEIGDGTGRDGDRWNIRSWSSTSFHFIVERHFGGEISSLWTIGCVGARGALMNLIDIYERQSKEKELTLCML